MRKVLLLSLSLALGFSAFAQQRVAKSDLRSFRVDSKKPAAVGKENVAASAAAFAPQTSKSVVVNRFENCEDGETMETLYDLQSNGWVSNRMYQLPDGSVAVVATMSHIDNPNGGADRGTGYNFYSNGEWMEMPDERVEDVRTGWPTIAQWGDKGEILIAHAPMRCWTREVAGEGEWVFRADLPISPDGFPYDDDASWPRVATSGDNHNIIHVIGDIQHQDEAGNYHHYQVYLRSENAEDWTCTYSPLAQDGEEYDFYTADNYNITANGHNVAIIYSDDLTGHLVMYKSTDDGLNWTRTVIWENPYYGCDWENDECSIYTDTVFGPSNTAIAIDNNGVVHVAVNTYEYIHDELGTTYTVFSGRGVDGIYYWNDTQEAPIQSTDGNPHHALRLWWPAGDGYMHMVPDSTKWIGYIPMYEGIDWENDQLFHENDYFYKMRGASAMPALSIDPMGNIACAFSAPNTSRPDDEGSDHFYKRSIYVSYRNVDEGYWHQVEDDITDMDLVNIMFMISENIFTNGVDNTYIPGEFWFSFQSDDKIGCYVGSYAYQTASTTNTIHAIKVVPDPDFVSVPENYEAKDVVYSIYPNPATDYVVVKSSENVEANISIVNLVGQTVKQFNKSLKMGENAISIDLKSGIYFCTISANGFNKTIKFVVK